MNKAGPILQVVGYTKGKACPSAELHVKGAGTMDFITKFVGLDVSRNKLAIAVADWETGSTRHQGVFANALDTIHKVLKLLGKPKELYVCYEARVTGYGLARFLTGLGIKCMVIAPSKISQAPGPNVNTDRKDAIMLAEKLEAGELVSVWVPSEADEALRGLVRAPEARVEDST
jgi:transposase